MKSKITIFYNLNQYVKYFKVTLEYNFVLYIFGLILISNLIFLLLSNQAVVHAETQVISPEYLSYYLRLSQNNYKVFEQTLFILPEEIYVGHCNLDQIVTQRFDSYCMNPDVISNHISGKKPAYECCQKYGIDWHRSYVIYNKNIDTNKPFYPGWEESFLNPKINPDFLPVPQGPRYGYSDWERGGSLYQSILYSEAKTLVAWVDSGHFNEALSYIKSNSDNLDNKSYIYKSFLLQVEDGTFLSSVDDARNFLKEVELRGLTFNEDINIVVEKKCLTC